MFKLFRRKSKDATASNPLQEKAAGWFVVKVLWLQGKWASYMNRKVNVLSVRSKKFGLMVFVGLSILICVSIVIETLTVKHSFKIRAIHSGKHFTSTGELPIASLIPDREYKRIVAFHHYMDSIAVANRRVYDSINHYRPGLLDSAIALEKLYHTQNK